MKFAIDAGHGNNTPGKRSVDGSLREFYFNNAVALEVTKILRNEYGQEVINPYDVTGKVDTPLNTRIQRANAAKVNAFISIHANAAGSGSWSSAEGIETFVYNQGAQPGSLALAANVQTAMIRATGRKNRGVKRANYAVLRQTNMPAILVEAGFMTSQAENALLKSDKYQKQIARAVAEGIAATYNLKPLKTPPAPVKKAAPVTKTDVGGISTMEKYFNPSGATKEAVISQLKKWEAQGLHDMHRKNLEKGSLTIDQAIGLLYVAHDRGYK